MSTTEAAVAVTEDGMYARGWLHAVAVAVRSLTLQNSQTNSCILSTRIGLAVLERHGVVARPQPVRAVAYNVEGYRRATSHTPIEQWPDTAWAVGIEGTGLSDPKTKRWDGHLVLVVRNPNRTRTLIDLTADQLHRPQHRINVPGPVFMDLPRPPAVWTPKDASYTTLGAKPGDPDTTIIGYMPLMTAGDWRDAPDWTSNPSKYVNTVCEWIRL